MKFTLSWLKEYLDTNATIEEIFETLNKIGLEVESIENKSKELEVFKSVFVEDCIPHPDSDHLRVCKVKTRGGDILQVVCGASNAKKGMKAILAPVGSVIPNNEMKIKKSKIRGIESCGMLCSAKELNLGNDATGIIELDENIELGKSIAEIYDLNDPLFDISITPNKGDCLGVYGIARDLAAAGLGQLKELYVPKIATKIKSPIKLNLQDNDCKCFGFRYIKEVKNCESPEWLKKRLMSIGLTPKSALVDISNYVMFCINKPIHCYDAKKIDGDIVIRKAKKGEKFLALDDKEYMLDEAMTVIADKKKILCLGGIIGGINSASSLETNEILLESALFDAINIAKTARKLAINSDAKFRFERGIDSLDVEKSLDIACRLIMDICGGETSEIIKVDNRKAKINFDRELDFNFSKTKKVLGFEVPRTDVLRILNNLGFKVKEDSKNLDVLHLVIPGWRNDVGIQEDIIDEIIRMYGYDRLPAVAVENKKLKESEQNILNKDFYRKLWQAKVLLASSGMDEIVSFSFMREDIAKEFALINDKMRLQNPITVDLAYMRPSIIPNLMNIIKKNNDRGYNNLCLFEEGRIFLNSEPEGQKSVIAGVRYGKTSEKDVYNSSRDYDIFDVKKDILNCLQIFGISEDAVKITKNAPDYYHPNKSGSIMLGKVYLGCFGEIHPQKNELFELKNRINAFELFLDAIPQKISKKDVAKKRFKVNDLQVSNRDFAFIVDKKIAVGEILDMVKKVQSEIIKNIHLFDIYEGEGMEEGKKSIAFSIKIQPNEKTLTSKEIDAISQKVIDGVVNGFGGVLRN
jgi:phenylalanyl-tRNA synthetase beta chain